MLQMKGLPRFVYPLFTSKVSSIESVCDVKCVLFCCEKQSLSKKMKMKMKMEMMGSNKQGTCDSTYPFLSETEKNEKRKPFVKSSSFFPITNSLSICILKIDSLFFKVQLFYVSLNHRRSTVSYLLQIALAFE
jgi:hypothetical protein